MNYTLSLVYQHTFTRMGIWLYLTLVWLPFYSPRFFHGSHYAACIFERTTIVEVLREDVEARYEVDAGE